MELSSKHISFTGANDMRIIAAPLKILEVSFFSCTLYYYNGEYISLTTHPKWYDFFLKKEVAGCCNVFNLQKGQYLWQQLFPDQAVADADNIFDIKNGIQLTYLRDDFVEVYSFASDSNSSRTLGLLLANADLLEKFVEYFRTDHKHIIEMAKKQRIILPEIMRGYGDIAPDFKLNHDDRKHFLQKIGYKTNIGMLSSRELEYLGYIARGKTAKSIGNILNVSNRTVESAIDNAKMKLDCYSREALIEKYWDYVGVE